MTAVDVHAVGEAHRLGHDWLGPEHLVLVIAKSREDRPATRALRRAGITPALVEDVLRRMDEAPPKRERFDGVRVSPATSQVMAFASGLAAADSGLPTQEHVLLGFLWQRRDQFVGLPVPELRSALVDEGVAVPAALT